MVEKVKVEKVKPDVSLEAIIEKLDKILEAVEGNTESSRELTKAVSDLTKENIKWYRAGRMGG